MKNASDWREILADSVTTPTELARRTGWDVRGLGEVTARYPMRINPYYLGLIEGPGDPLYRQAVPDFSELHDHLCPADPLAEEALSPTPAIVHKYPDRVLFLVHGRCAMYCRFCTRKRKVGTMEMSLSDEALRAGIDYIARTPQVRDVLVSGGDPLLLDDDRLDRILSALRAIPTVEIIRIGTRVPCTLPMRVTEDLAHMLGRHHPLYINTHFNHPRELTSEAAAACGRLAAAGIPLGCQTVLLRGVNDDAATMRSLMRGLLKMRVKPYYLFQGDLAKGTDHFRVPVDQGLAIMRSLIGHLSGMAVPTFAVDAPGGGGKIPLTPEYIISKGRELVFRNYEGRVCRYIDAG